MKLRFYSTKRGVFVFDKDFSPCRLQASLTHSTAQMRTPFCDSESHRGAFESLWLWQKIKDTHKECPYFLAQEEGFEPPCLLGKRFSRPPRCDRFDIPAYIWCGLLHHIYAVLFRSGSWNSFHESASHTPRRCVKLACKQQVRASSSEIILRCSKSSYQLFNC